MKLLLMSLVAVLATACARGYDGAQGPAGAPAPTPAPPITTTLEQDVQSLLTDENNYREGLGQTELSSGLGCTLYTVTGGDRIQASIAGHNTLTGISQVATFLLSTTINQPDGGVNVGLNVLPQALQSIYTNLYLLRCQGQLVVTDTGYQEWDLTSDDGSVLYIDGAKVIDNDNNHGSTTVSGMKYLRRGVHTIRLDYAQTGAGNESLVLKMNGDLINPVLYAH